MEGGVLWGTMDMIDRAFQIGFPFDDDNKLRKEILLLDFPSFLMVICVTVCLQLMDGCVGHAVLLTWKLNIRWHTEIDMDVLALWCKRDAMPISSSVCFHVFLGDQPMTV
jgi:hypothetical protein